eukprot:jgi/Undpi1/4671/HiC_scaffold_18.g08025.m1
MSEGKGVSDAAVAAGANPLPHDWVRGAKAPAAPATPTSGLSFTSTNEYPAIIGSAWPHLAEPYKVTQLSASSTIGNPEKDVFTWTFADTTVLEGREVKHTFTKLGRQEVSIEQVVSATGESHTLHAYVMVKYVRREIRQLLQKDREEFFDTMETLYRLPTAEGVLLYGEEYKGINFFVQMHLDGAGVTDCDHWHDDAGIMTHHIGYTLLFEQALQVVSPAVTIPYWEYTIEAAEGLDMYGDSEIFADDWFGSASPANHMHTVDTGRWAFTPVKQDAWDYVHNSYGLLRTPWNVDPTPFVTRHNMTNDKVATSVVSCMGYQSCFESTTLSKMNNCLNGGTHGPVHIAVGGEWSDPEQDFIVNTGYASDVPLTAKYLWRKGYMRTPESCTMSEQELYESRGMTPYDVLMDTVVLHWLAPFTGGIIKHLSDEDRFVIAGHEDDAEFQDAFWKKMLNSLCDVGHVGELYTSSAPYDPLFWVIHPTAERFFSWRRKLAKEQPDEYAFDETWGYDHGNVIGETGSVCDWSAVKDNSLDMPTCVTGVCGGHGADDMLPFGIKVDGKIIKMTNVEWLDFIYPDNEDLPYMYNEFAWDHCA